MLALFDFPLTKFLTTVVTTVDQCGSQNSINVLLENGAAVDAIDDVGCTALHHAAYCGEEGAVRVLLDTGRAFLAAETRDGTTPMLLAALAGHANLALEHLDGTSVVKDNAHGDTLLWAAVVNEDWPLCSKLVRRDGLGSIDAPQLGALKLSCLQRVLLELPLERANKIVPALMLAGASIHYRAADGKTPLHFAAYFGSPEQVRRIIAAGADVHAVDFGKNTPLHFCRHPESVKLLIDAGADIHASNREFNTPLHAARALHGEDVAAVLVAAGADG